MARIARLQDQEGLRPVGQGTVVTVRPPEAQPRRQQQEQEPAVEAGGPAFPPRWVPPVSTAICALAFADSAYLTYAHYTSVTALACPTSGFVDCAAVTTSAYSHPFGVPVAVAGLAWTFVMGILCSPWGWRTAQARWWPWTARLRLAGRWQAWGWFFTCCGQSSSSCATSASTAQLCTCSPCFSFWWSLSGPPWPCPKTLPPKTASPQGR